MASYWAMIIEPPIPINADRAIIRGWLPAINFRRIQMTMFDNKPLTENELSIFGKTVIALFVFFPVCILTIINICLGKVSNPYAFAVCIFGFLLFLISKVSLFKKGIWFSFGAKRLSENMGNSYRLGYWFMSIGIILTFI